MKDLHGRAIWYLRVSVTENCNLRCKYCMPNDKKEIKPTKEILTLEESFRVIEACHHLGITKVRITGGEPLVREGIIPFIKKIAQLEHMQEVAMTTNGILLEQHAKALKEAGLDRINISLDTLDPHKYHDITGGGHIEQVLRGIKAAKEYGLGPIKINTVLIKGFNDDELQAFATWSDKWDIEVRFIELMPIGEGISWSKEKYLSAEKILEQMPELQRLEHTKAATAASYGIKGTKTKIGLITPMSCKFCEDCNRMRLTARGRLKMCLHASDEVDLKEALRTHQALEPLIMNAVQLKADTHHLEDKSYVHKGMYQIGG
jgi:cyclic pyranopterin phosphate synthase